MGKVPFTPFGWTEIPSVDFPASTETFDPAFAQAGNTITRIMLEHSRMIGAPSYSAAVLVDHEIVWRGAVGWADLETRTPATPETIYRIGSTSKAITATALAKMVDRGEIDLDEPISNYLSNLPNPDLGKVTPRQLASHMSGIPHYKQNTEIFGLFQTIRLQKDFATVQEAITLFDNSDLRFEPGTQFEYSSPAVTMLGAVMSEAAKKPYRQIIEDDVLKPAAATSTEPAPRAASRNSSYATFYYQDGEKLREWRPVDLSHRLPGGGYASTPSDLVRIGSLQLRDKFISSKTRQEFWTPQRLVNGEVNEQDYAIGWRWREWDVDGLGIARNANHGGVSRGSQNWLLVFPDYEMVIAFSANLKTKEFHHFGMLYEDILREFGQVVDINR